MDKCVALFRWQATPGLQEGAALLLRQRLQHLTRGLALRRRHRLEQFAQVRGVALRGGASQESLAFLRTHLLEFVAQLLALPWRQAAEALECLANPLLLLGR